MNLGTKILQFYEFHGVFWITRSNLAWLGCHTSQLFSLDKHQMANGHILRLAGEHVGAFSS